uniref:Uncharacterized protein n=1 Tax=Cannabis sativa TaxID=3483 RepID=A0A803QRN0_CANSA
MDVIRRTTASTSSSLPHDPMMDDPNIQVPFTIGGATNQTHTVNLENLKTPADTTNLIDPTDTVNPSDPPLLHRTDPPIAPRTEGLVHTEQPLQS